MTDRELVTSKESVKYFPSTDSDQECSIQASFPSANRILRRVLLKHCLLICSYVICNCLNIYYFGDGKVLWCNKNMAKFLLCNTKILFFFMSLVASNPYKFSSDACKHIPLCRYSVFGTGIFVYRYWCMCIQVLKHFKHDSSTRNIN